ncbi:MAG: hypothetical protein DYH17_04195 [Xanthomonadales bacterium PRO6]|nr:hypothetical protein [Xanthomonadales bacterium]MCE7930560.1 hypothetical protein [Xanthomonadales bacterium PRO6]
MPDSNPSGPTPEIARADPAERRRTFWLLLLVAICGAALIAAFEHEIAAIRAQVDGGVAEVATDRFLWLASSSFALLAIVGTITAFVIGRASLAVIREQRYPHAAARLLRDHQVLRGPAAVRRGRLGLALAAGFALVGCGGAVYGWRLLTVFA